MVDWNVLGGKDLTSSSNFFCAATSGVSGGGVSSAGGGIDDLGLARDLGFLDGDPGVDIDGALGVPLGVERVDLVVGLGSGSGVCCAVGGSSSASEPRFRARRRPLRRLSI